jgi:TPP-dependent pyruvate/acetoin dehydrogenase alpha subunit
MIEDKGVLMEMLNKMLRIRYFEEQAIDMVQKGELVGAVHCYIGEEAVAVGACAALRNDDYITGNHRSHGHPIAKGADVERAMAELLGKATGYCKGKGGSMHLADFSVGILGESGILASALPVAVGAAMGSKMQGTDRVVVAFFGDGASSEGACHEAMNLASVWKLPVIFLCENNQYAVTTNFKDTVSVKNISDRASAYDMPGVLVDGQDVVAMYEAVTEAVDRARSGQGPSLIEGKTYRYREHSEGIQRIGGLEAEPYRSKEEVEYWKGRDPISIHKELLVEHAMATTAEIEEMEAKVKAEIGDALEFARTSPYPEPEAIFEDMFADPIHIDRS